MIIRLSEIPDNKSLADFPPDTEFSVVDTETRFILEPFERVFPDDPRYETALTYKDIDKMNEQLKQDKT